MCRAGGGFLAFRVEGSSRDPVALRSSAHILRRPRIWRDVYKSPLSPSSFFRMTVGSRSMFVRLQAIEGAFGGADKARVKR